MISKKDKKALAQTIKELAADYLALSVMIEAARTNSEVEMWQFSDLLRDRSCIQSTALGVMRAVGARGMGDYEFSLELSRLWDECVKAGAAS